MTRNGSTTPLPNEFMTPPSCKSHTSRGRRGSIAFSHAGAPTARGYSRLHDRSLVDDAPRPEPQACELRLPALRRNAARDERPRIDRAGRRRLEAAACPHGVRPRGTAARQVAERGRVASPGLAVYAGRRPNRAASAATKPRAVTVLAIRSVMRPLSAVSRLSVSRAWQRLL